MTERDTVLKKRSVNRSVNMTPKAKTSPQDKSSLLRRWASGRKKDGLSGKFVDVDEAAFTLEVALEEKRQVPLRPKNVNVKSTTASPPSSSPSSTTGNKLKVKRIPPKKPAHVNAGILVSLAQLGRGKGKQGQPVEKQTLKQPKTTESSSPSSATTPSSKSHTKVRSKKKEEATKGRHSIHLGHPTSSPTLHPDPTNTSPNSSGSSSEAPLPSVANFSKPTARRHSSEKLMYARSVLSRPYFLDLDTPTIPTSAWILHVSPLPTHFDPHDGPHGRWKYTVSIRPKVFADFSKHSPPGTSVLRSLHDFVWFESALHAEYDGALLVPLLAMAMAQYPNPDEASNTLTWPIQTIEGGSLFPTAKQTITQSSVSSISGIPCDNNPLEQGLWDPAVECRHILHQALHASSSTTSGIPRGSDRDQSQQVPGILLQHWLQDILHGTRARGEFYIPSSVEAKTWIQSLGWKPRNKFEHVVMDVTESEAWEIFFYRKSASGESLAIYFEQEQKRQDWVQEETSRLVLRGLVPFPTTSTTSKLGFLSNIIMHTNCLVAGRPISTLIQDKPVSSSISLPRMGSLLSQKSDDTAYRYGESILTRRWTVHQQLGKHVFGKHNLQARDFFTSFEPRVEPSPALEMIETQKYLTFFHREYALQVLYRLRLLMEHELIISAAWKRFAISLSNIYACERDVDKATSGLGEVEEEELSETAPVDRLSKSELDDALRIYVKQKAERAVPSLRLLSQAVYTHYMDLCSMETSLISMDLASTLGEDSRSVEDKSPAQENIHLMQSRLRRVNQSMNIRTARMAWAFFNTEVRHAELLHTAAKTLHNRLKNNICILPVQDHEEEVRNQLEDIVRRMLQLAKPRRHQSSGNHSISGGNSVSSRSYSRRLEEEENESIAETSHSVFDENHDRMVEETLRLLHDCGGIWDKNVAEIILKNSGVTDINENMDQLSSNIKIVSKLSQNLRQSITRCYDALSLLEKCLIGKSDTGIEASANTQIAQMRLVLLSSMSRLFCAPKVSMMRENQSSRWVTDYRPSKANLEKLGVELIDVYGWLHRKEDFVDEESDELLDNELRTEGIAQCGQIALNYIHNVRDRGIQHFIREIKRILQDYEERILKIDSFIYVSAVGFLLEKHFSKLRTDSLQAWEKKTDIITAINVATKKRLDLVVQELEKKLEEFDPSVSHAGVKDAKERHLASKVIKSELEALAHNQFMMLKPACMDRVLEIIRLWAQYDESISEEEIPPLRNFIREMELSTRDEDIQTDGGYHLIASFVLQNEKIHGLRNHSS